MIRVLLTGASGLCGRTLAAQLSRRADIELVTTARRPLPGAHVVHDLAAPLVPGAGGFPERIDAVIHAAAEVDEGSDDFGLLQRNLAAAANVASYARAVNARALVHLSSVSIYGPASGRACFAESSPRRPATLYALSKSFTEQLLDMPDDLAVAHLRLAYVLGPGMPDRTVIKRFYRALSASEPVELVNGTASRLQFIAATDIAAACEQLLRRPWSGTVNLAAPERPSLHALVEAIARHVPDTRSAITDRADPERLIDVDYASERLDQALPGFTFRPIEVALGEALA